MTKETETLADSQGVPDGVVATDSSAPDVSAEGTNGAGREAAPPPAPENEGAEPAVSHETDDEPSTETSAVTTAPEADVADGKEATATPPTAPSEAAAPPKRRRPKDPALYRAFRSKRPVQGKIVGVIKGGYEVRVGRSRAFCPHSQLDLHRIDNPEEQVGKSYTFRIAQLRRGGEDVVVSRRMLLEAERADEANAVRASLLEGSIIQGRVAGIAAFGAFVDLGAGVTGLIHVSELGHSRVSNVAEAVSVGDSITVKIIKIHPETGKISLSARRAQEDPWKSLPASLAPGSIVEGRVLRVPDFGAFVEILPGVEALAPAREFPPKPEGWRDGLEPGVSRRWFVMSVDPKRRRISLSEAPDSVDDSYAQPPEAGQARKGRVQKVETFGVFVWLGPGSVGMMPNVLSGQPRGTDMPAKFPLGLEIDVEVVDVTDGGRRIRLAAPGQAAKARERTASRPRPERAPAREQQAAPTEPAGSFGTSLADKLRAALDRGDT